MKQKVALVLSSGGARGLAHIGAIEALEEQGYEIASIAGTSMGAFVGGMYAAGQLGRMKNWVNAMGDSAAFNIENSSNAPTDYFANGDKLMARLKSLIPDISIEHLPIPFKAVAADLRNGCEIIFDQGSLYDGIKASISLPSMFRPVKTGDKLLVDGGAVNPLPLNRVERTDDDLLIAVNVEAQGTKKHGNEVITGSSFVPKRLPSSDSGTDNYYLSILSKTISLMMHQIAAQSLALTPPDILVEIPKNLYSGFDYGKAKEIVNNGKNAMLLALEKHSHTTS